ncbi:hypothetical protein BMS3Abin06_00034 [bacterium BMS3Abin06]|nr:hypothetical protein BMS3Abin06_00034 [bacterium BMS3Abin06]
MSDKTPLELDIEHRERYRMTLSVKILIVLLLISICIAGVYSFKLKKQISEIEREAVVMKESFRKEKVELLRQIKQLQAKHVTSETDIN